MSVMHRPLSDWVARLVPPPAGTADMPRLDVINDGDERSDAREFSMFGGGWVRRRVTVADRAGRVHVALALHYGQTGTTIVELDDYGVPVSISEAGVVLVDKIERAWPEADLSREDLDTLGAESLELRFFLLNRLAVEGHPAPGLFHVLPWNLVDVTAHATMVRLDGGESADPGQLRHWLTPAMSGVTGPLEQLHQGLVDGDPERARAGATALCRGLMAAEIARIPLSTADTLAELLEKLGQLNPILHHTAAVVAERFRTSENQDGGFTLEFESGLPAAASSSTSGVRYHAEHREDDSPLTVQARITAGGRLSIIVEIAIEAGPARDRLLDSYQVVFFPVTINADDRSDRYWLPLDARRRSLAGVIELHAPRGRVHIDADGPPVGVWELAEVTARELLPSLRAADTAGLEIWQGLADQLPTDHPVSQAARALHDPDHQ